jgi:sugar phosphate permease
LYVGVSVMAPALRSRFHLSLADVGILLACLSAGATMTLLGWGVLADRVGERAVIGVGLIAASAALAESAMAGGFWSLAFPLTLAAMLGASVNAASGRAVMHWFAPNQRGVALGIRQTAIPLGGLAASLALPHFAVRTGFLALAVAVLIGGVIGWLLVREGPLSQTLELPSSTPGGPLRDRRLWRLSSASALLSTPQVCLVGFAVLFLHDARGLSIPAAAGLVAVMQVLSAIMRIGAGRWSDRVGTRLAPLRWLSIALFVAVALSTALVSAPTQLLLPVLAVAGGFAMGWNALAFTAAAELAGYARSGAALGLQQTALGVWAAIAAPAFALLVASTSWRTGFALVALTAIAAHRVLAGLRS